MEDGEAIEMSRDHNPGQPSETQRIEKYGGYVKNDRIKGRLGVARGFGAYQYKDRKTFGERFVTVEPEIKTYPINKGTQFMIMATDGIWCKISSEEAIKFVKEKLKENDEDFQKNPEQIIYDICMSLVKEAENKLSKDNISCILIVFQHNEQEVTSKQSIHNDNIELVEIDKETKSVI